MPAYGFKERFAIPILAGRKTMTIRRHGGIKPSEGQTLYAYLRRRTPQQTLLGVAEIKKVSVLYLQKDCRPAIYFSFTRKYSNRSEDDFWNRLARKDGFVCGGEMKDFFYKNHPGIQSKGGKNFWVIEWERFTPAEGLRVIGGDGVYLP